MENLPFSFQALPSPRQQPGRLDIRRDMARKGLYSYECVSEDTAVWDRGSYELVFSPEPPLQAGDLPGEIRELLSATRVKRVKFAKDRVISRELVLRG